MKKLIRVRNLFMSSTIMCTLIVMTFTFESVGIKWFWSENIIAVTILGFLAIFFGYFWFRIQREIRKLNSKISRKNWYTMVLLK